MKILAVVPARYSSQRFPGKPLVMIGERPMVQWVYEAANSCAVFHKVIVATDDDRIVDCVKDFGGEVTLTRADHTSGTDRVAEVAALHPEMDVIVNVQGDQPFVTAEMLQQLVSPYLADKWPDMTTLGCPLNQDIDYHNENVVKVVCDRNQNALYFSRSPIPFYRNHSDAPVLHHLGLYAFRKDFLATYATLPPTPLEHCEALEQLRVLEHGYSIRVCQTPSACLEINTPEDLVQAQKLIHRNGQDT
jgi:3-deoxy-manno-octulosonate cytidylyltransferase (CMP-KDO synthetase)